MFPHENGVPPMTFVRMSQRDQTRAAAWDFADTLNTFYQALKEQGMEDEQLRMSLTLNLQGHLLHDGSLPNS